MELTPIGDRLKVLPLRPPATTKGGLYLPETSSARERPQQGLVLAAGRGHVVGTRLVPLECDKGDVVAFGSYAGVSVSDGNGLDVLLMRESEVLGRKPARQLAKDTDEWVIHNDVKHLIGDPRCTRCQAEEEILEVLAPEEGVPL